MRKQITAFRAAVMFALLVFAFGVMIVLNVNTGSQSIEPASIFRIIFYGSDGSKAADIIWKLRLPRLLAAALLGGALSVSGFLLQTFFRNPIAGPYVLGISSGAKLLVGVMLVFVYKTVRGVPFWATMAASFLGSMLITAFVLLFARRIRNAAGLLVIGIMIGSICQAITDFFVTFADETDVANLHNWSMGSFASVKWADLPVVAFLILGTSLGAHLLSKPISAYQLGENYARSMGVNVKLFRVALISLSGILSACVTALSGPISFIGVAVPHMTKLLFGTAKPVIIIPGSFLLGSVFCMGCDLIARTAFSPTELAISTVTAAFGAPVVIWLMASRQRRRDNG